MSREKVEHVLSRSKGTGITFLLFLALLGIWTLIAYLANLSNGTVAIGSYAIITACIVLASFYNAFTSEGKGWLNGLIGGAMFLAVTAIFGMIALSGDFDVLSFAKKCPLYLVISTISGIIGINVK